MPFVIPENLQRPLARLLKLSEESWTELLNAIEKIEPTLSTRDYAKQVTSAVGPKIEEADTLTDVLLNLLWVRERYRSTPEFLKDIRKAAEESKEAEVDDTIWECFEQHFSQLLRDKTSAEITAKAWDLSQEYERLFVDARIISDLRPLFRSDVEEQPTAMLIGHNLKVAFREKGSFEEIHIELDIDDLKTLQRIVNRALKKDKSLRSLLSKSHIRYIGLENQE